MIQDLWLKYFPSKGKVPSLNHEGLWLEVSYFGFLTIGGSAEDVEADLPLYVTAKQLFKLLVEDSFTTDDYTAIIYDEIPSELRIFFNLYDCHGVVALFSRHEIENILNQK